MEKRVYYVKRSVTSVRTMERKEAPGAGIVWVACALLALCLCGLILCGLRERAVALALDEAPTRTVRVLPGDSLWAIAERQDWSGPAVREAVRWMLDRNGLPSARLSVGDELVVPVCQDSFGTWA